MNKKKCCTDVNTASYKNHLQCLMQLTSEGKKFQLYTGLNRVSLTCLEHLIKEGLDVSGWDIVEALKNNQVSKFYLLAEAYPEALEGVKYQLLATAIYNEQITILRYLLEDRKLSITTTNSLALCLNLATKGGANAYLHILEYLASKHVAAYFEHAVLLVCQEQHEPTLQKKLECLDHMVRLKCVIDVTPLALRKLAQIEPDPMMYPHLRRLLMEATESCPELEAWKTAARETLREIEQVVSEVTRLPVEVVRYEVMGFL